MTLYLSNRDGNGKTSEEGHFKFPVNTYTGNILTATDLVVSQQTPAAMGVSISPGQFRIPDITGSFAYTGWSNSATNVSIPTADPANPRLSAIVLYIDKNAPTSPSPTDNPGIPKFLAVQGTPAATPVIPNGTTIQAAIGAGNPYIILASARVNAAGTTVTTANITDLRVLVTVAPNLVNTASIQANSVDATKIPDNTITTAKIQNGNVTTQKTKPTYIVQAGSTDTTTRQSFTLSNTVYSITGTSFTYTSGPTNEVLDLDANALINPDAAPDGQFFIAVNGVAASKSHYVSQANIWTACRARVLYPIAANTTITIDARYRTGGATATGSVCNATSDQSSSPSFGVEVRLIAWGRT